MAIPVIYNAEYTSEHLAIVDSIGNIYTLPHSFHISAQRLKRRKNIVRMAFSNGGHDVADGRYEPRKVTIEGHLWANSEDEFRAKVDELLFWLNKEHIFLRENGRMLRVTRIDDVGFSYNTLSKYGKLSISVYAEDPFWYSENLLIKEFTVTSSPFSFAITVRGTVETYPVILLTNNADNANFTIENKDDNRALTIQDPAALSGTVISIDCQEGTVYRDDTNNILQYMTGQFIRLLPSRENHITYTGANAVLQIQYREAYL